MHNPNSAIRTLNESIGTFMGRDALELAASSLGLTPSDTVLMPGYVCKEVVRSFHGKSKIAFYDVELDLSVMPQEIERRFDENRPKALLLINYFGFLQPHRKALADLCRRQNAILIEDCAHSLLTAGSGESGDFCIYSFRKLLPVPDGGALNVKRRVGGWGARFQPRFVSNLLSVLIILKLRLKVRSEALSRAGIATRAKGAVAARPEANGRRRYLPISWFAERGIRKADIASIVSKRRADFLSWQEWSRDCGLCSPIFSHLDDGVCPLGFPVRSRARDELKGLLDSRGILLKVHWRRLPEIGETCPNSLRLSDEALTLPIYPELAVGDRERIIEAFTEVCARHRMAKGCFS